MKIDLTIYPEKLKHAVERARERNIIIPTMKQMKNPELVPDSIKNELSKMGLWMLPPAICSGLPGKMNRRRPAVCMVG